MHILFESRTSVQPSVSIVLLDWSVRESYHTLYYLNNQTIPREKYEIIWVEYYDKRPKEIKMKLKECAVSGRPPILDTWVVMNMPSSIYYHKHLMYNVGIVVGKGHIITFMDSDAIVKPTFVESIIKSFEKDSNIVLHMDQVRNMNKKFYPFNYPSIDEVTKEGCVNLVNGKPRGLVDSSEPLHIPNYGSCMSAMRDDIISIAGADEHIDYLGHICGPYEMTFRLINAGKKKVWHPDEWLYHTWHPGQAGDRNIAGPHDGRHMSQTALSARRTGRIFPLVENPAIKALRLKDKVSSASLSSMVISEKNIKEWMIEGQKYDKVSYSLGSATINIKECRKQNNFAMSLTSIDRNTITNLRGHKLFIKIFLRYINTKLPLIKETVKGFLSLGIKKDGKESINIVTNPAIQVKGIVDFIRLVFNFLKYSLWWSNHYVINRCWQCLDDLSTIGVKEVTIFGVGNVSQVLHILSKAMPISITDIYDSPVKKKRFLGYKVLPLEAIKNYKGKVIIASFDDMVEKSEMLKKMGIKDNMIVDLW